MPTNYKVAIVGASGLVGRTVLKVLEERTLPHISYTLFASSKSAGSKIRFLGKDYIICELNEKSFDKHFDYAIFCARRKYISKICFGCCFKGLCSN